MNAADQLDRERRRYRSLQEIALAIGSTLDLDPLLRLIVAKITDLMDADRSSLFVMDDERRELWTRVIQADEVQEIRLPLGRGVAGWVAEHGEPAIIADAYQDPRFSAETDRRSGYRTKSILCVPMRNHQGEISGVVQVLNKRDGGAFSQDDAELLAALASQAAVAVENTKLYQSVVRKNEQLVQAQRALERRMRERDLLLEMQTQINAATFLDELLEALLAHTSEMIGAEAAAIILREGDGERLLFRSAIGSRGGALKDRTLTMGQGIAGWVTQHGESAVVTDPGHDPRHLHAIAEQVGFLPRDILCVPLQGTERPLGAIELLNKIGGTFDHDDERLLSLIAGAIAQAIELAQVKEQRIHDGRLASIGQMLAGVLHDLKTPMTVISGYAQLMAQNDDPSIRGEYVAQILKQFEVLAAMTREVLAFARGESNVLIRKVYLHKFLEEIKRHLLLEFADKGVTLVVEAEHTGVAYFDENKFHRVFHNIARNAAQAMPGGGTFRVGVRKEGAQLVMSFADTGGGIPEEIQGRLFRAFATAGKVDGTGLGLAIVKKIVQEHQGEIACEATSAAGTTFTIRLPFVRQGLTAEVPTGGEAS